VLEKKIMNGSEFSLSDFSAHRNGLTVLKELADSACYKATN